VKVVSADAEVALKNDQGVGSHPAAGRLALRRLWRFKWGLVASAVLAVIVGIAALAPYVAPYDPLAVNIRHRLGPPAWMAGGTSAHVLGTDQIGRDLLSRMIYGARTTIFIAVLATALSFILGSVLGFSAAVARGLFDIVMSRFVDLLMAVPTLIFALVVLSVLPTTLAILILVMGILDATRVYRLSRAVAADVNVMDYVEAAKLRGERIGWIIFREILPNALSPLVAELGLRFIYAVLFLSALSFLGLGVQPPSADWGGMVKENKEGIVFGIPAALIPAGAIAALAISVNLVADWILNRTSSLKGGRG
jgi:peptide/nickel transport system permease protein